MQDRLLHGYTNATSLRAGHVHKRYIGPDAAQRQTAEIVALTNLRGIVPIPQVVSSGPGELVLSFVNGVHGQELLETAPEKVLAEVGRTAARLQKVEVARLPLDAVAGGTVLVHGDFGPQNMLFDPHAATVTALIDWETAHIGGPVEDIAWAEWIVRFHHPHLTSALSSLYAGFGRVPAWSERQAEMVNKCLWAVDFVDRWGQDDTSLWARRLKITEAFSE